MLVLHARTLQYCSPLMLARCNLWHAKRAPPTALIPRQAPASFRLSSQTFDYYFRALQSPGWLAGWLVDRQAGRRLSSVSNRISNSQDEQLVHLRQRHLLPASGLWLAQRLEELSPGGRAEAWNCKLVSVCAAGGRGRVRCVRWPCSAARAEKWANIGKKEARKREAQSGGTVASG